MKITQNTYRLKSPLALLALTLAGVCHAAQGAEPLRLQKVQKYIYAIVGPLGNRMQENLGNNATFGFLVVAPLSKR
jgi:hypothetical protein